jgi:tyrosine-protein kinase Etk/Wzc
MSIHPIEKDREQIHRSTAMESSAGGNVREQEVQLMDLVATTVDSWRLILGSVIAFLLAGIVYITLATPVYRADVMLQIEENSKGVGALSDLSMLFQDEVPVSAEFEILRSRMVLGDAVDNLKLNIVTTPVYFPLLGAVIARRNGASKEIADVPWFAPSSYAWGGESIQVESFFVPAAYEGKTFTLIANDGGQYELLDPEYTVLAKGAVGETATIDLGNDEFIKLYVSELRSRSGTRFELIKKDRLEAINELKEALKIVELGKQSGIIQISLEGGEKDQITTILNKIANIYLRQSVERKSEEAEKTLSFLEKQLPKVKERMENAEAELNKYRLKKGSVDLPKETLVTLDKMVSIDAQLTELRREREDLIRRFAPRHPRITALDAQIDTLNNEIVKVETKVQSLPSTQQEILRLTRDMEVSTSLYTTLMNSAQELKVVKAGAIGNVRIVDYAVNPYRPISPNKGLVIAMIMVFGILIGIATAFIRKSLRDLVEDPDVIEKKLGLPIYATVPCSRKQRELEKSVTGPAGNPNILALSDSSDPAIESLRSLRTSLYFAQLNAKNNIISVTSSGPHAGKTFICVNLGAVLANAGKRVLIIDADMRKGRLHDYFGIERKIGLSDVIANHAAYDEEFKQATKKTAIENLFVIPAGTIPPNPSELLMHEKFALALELMATDFDQVIIDTPPALAVTDAAIIGNLAGTTLLVVKDSESPLRELERCIKQLKHAGVNLRGAVYNNIKSASSRYGYGKYYGYSHHYSK